MATFKARIEGLLKPHRKLVQGYNKGYNEEEFGLPSS